MQDVELHMDPAIAERNPSGIALMHQLTEPIHRPHLIGIDGRSGAGKTSLAGQLAQVLSVTRDVVVFHLEDLYPGWDGLDRGIAMYEESILSPLRDGRDAYWTAWDWLANSPGGPRLTRAAEIVVLEGVGACSAPAREVLDVSVWVELPEIQRRERALNRDSGFEPYWDMWAQQELDYLQRDPVWESATIIQPGPTG
ncbi:hypothetical protein [Kocuria palustris]|uniref:hypothetical protein n=1 Tax=Kocuria palustris TaxID=71999 RepID=UPI002469856B|nr:hypothetical protein [Kocuria palustris]MDH5152636.1 hypothetical protein [Kocuria palustris]